MDRVLVSVDRSENRAFHQAQYVSRLPNADHDVEATELYVVPPDEFTGASAVDFSDVYAAVAAANLLEGEGVSVTRAVDDGGISEQIVRSADELDANEVVMGGRKRSEDTVRSCVPDAGGNRSVSTVACIVDTLDCTLSSSVRDTCTVSDGNNLFTFSPLSGMNGRHR